MSVPRQRQLLRLRSTETTSNAVSFPASLKRFAEIAPSECRFPGKGVRDDLVEIAVYRFPAELLMGSRRISNHRRHVTRPRLAKLDLEAHPRDAPDGVDQLKDRKASAISTIYGQANPTAPQPRQSKEVSIYKVCNMHEVADARAITGRIVGTEDRDGSPLSQR